MDRTLERYRENVGHDPSPCPSEAVWQWTYSGRPAERELLLDLVQTEAEAQLAFPETADQETLF